MQSPELTIRNLGPLKEADIKFGDLTVFVGPQASGKSIALQCVKLAADASTIRAQLLDYGTDWSGSTDFFLDAYFGEGMHALWKDGKTKLAWYGHELTPTSILKKRAPKGNKKKESVFLIPAQRVLTLRDGWPRPFADYRASDPYAVRSFSEKLKSLMEFEFRGGALFPKANRLKSEYRSMLTKSIFGGFSLDVSSLHSQKRLVLQQGNNEYPLPFMVWSAGQREFVPLLLGLYWLMPPSKVAKRGDIEWVILEEPEMGLHPRAISTLLLIVLELIARGYKVCLSTHSPQVLNLIWAWRSLQASGDKNSSALLDLLGAKKTASLRKVADEVFSKKTAVYYFESGMPTREITELDTASSSEIEANWGGLLEFSDKANEVVSTAFANSESPK